MFSWGRFEHGELGLGLRGEGLATDITLEDGGFLLL